jgi:hypothetical protein
MNKLLSATLLTFVTAPTFLLFTQTAQADTKTSTYCYPVVQREVIQNAADHPTAYTNGYSEGRQSVRKGDAYKPRSAGGEFSRGFDDGYYGHPFSGQQYAVPDRVREFTTQQCETYTGNQDNDDRYYGDRDRRDWRRPMRPEMPRPPYRW